MMMMDQYIQNRVNQRRVHNYFWFKFTGMSHPWALRFEITDTFDLIGLQWAFLVSWWLSFQKWRQIRASLDTTRRSVTETTDRHMQNWRGNWATQLITRFTPQHWNPRRLCCNMGPSSEAIVSTHVDFELGYPIAPGMLKWLASCGLSAGMSSYQIVNFNWVWALLI